ncbi:Anaphase-promoting complex subunit 5 [Erysiphe neolycopersici]|uniref:Anaphase-promoting complex subunit 5 n=1 Tax=Erysiphe neolycopersici TaxID=212602 RepID=A0A420I3X5_9PEZI|nr:Anaphase-promoting complex subunit 5 [Erysiphe neolycopersici]
MSRYLTPSKIGLLILIELYVESNISSSTISIMSFILNHLLPHAPKPQSPESISYWQFFSHTLPLTLDLKSFESLLDSHSASSSSQCATLWDSFQKKLWDIDSLDALHVFFSQLTNLLVRTHEEIKKDNEIGIPLPSKDMILLSRTSPFGSFIRKSSIEFERLKFCDSIALWTAFNRWRYGDKCDHMTNKEAIPKWVGDMVLNDLENNKGKDSKEKFGLIVYTPLKSHDTEESYISTDDVGKLLEFQVEKMQRFGNRVPVEIMTRFKSILDQSILIPSLSHYLIFLESWRSGDYTTSFDSIHRYFDYTIQNRDRSFYQYALMNLAVLQADFCCFDEAAAAMLETVSIARENKDMACLNFALNWLYHFGKIHPNITASISSTNMLGAEREGLAYLRIKAKESEMWTLWSSSLLSEGRLGLSNGESVAIVFENIIKSSHLIVEKNLKSMIGPQIAIQSSLWGRLGVCQLFKQHCEIFLHYHAQYTVFEDVLRFTSRIAFLLLDKGHYDEALEMLQSLDSDSLRSWKAHHHWLMCKGIIRLKRALHHNNLESASQLLNQLLHSYDEFKDVDLSPEISILQVDYFIRQSDYSLALQKIEDVLSPVREERNDIYTRTRLMVLKALLFDKAGRPQKGFSVAMRAASTAWRARLMPILWLAMAAIANILTSLSEFQASAQILMAVLPRALECEDYTLNAQLYSFLGDALMGLAGQAETGSKERKVNLSKSYYFLERALAEYSSLEDYRGKCEMTAKIASIKRVMGETSDAMKLASAYLELKTV